MTTVASSRRNGSLPTKWQSRSADNTRKSNGKPDDYWSRDEHSHSLHCTNSDAYQPGCESEHDMKIPETRTSEDSVIGDGETNVSGNAPPKYGNSLTPTNADLKHNDETTVHRSHRHNYDYAEFSVPQAVVAMQKLQRLKELQRRRDLTERYYSQQIRRLIGEHYFSPRMTMPAVRFNEKPTDSSVQPYSGDKSKNILKTLEPCGTMTTITRLDCGCVQETTRPIFTTARGRVQKKMCTQSQDQVLLKLTSSNPQEHLYSSAEPHKTTYYPSKSKKRLPLDSKQYAKIPEESDHEVEAEEDQRNNTQKLETNGRTSRNVSPRRKFSDTSTTSI